MGTDIYLYAEIKRAGQWQLLGELEKNREYYPEDKPNAQLHQPVEIYHSRNYALFAMLAGMRNSRSHTLDNRGFDVIAPPRGLPEDLGAELRNWLLDWEWNDQEESEVSSPSWLLLSEVLQFDWQGKKILPQAMVDARVAHLFADDQPFPFRQWPQNIPLSYASYLRDGVAVRWTSTYADAAGADFMQLLKMWQQQGDPRQIRLVFWFAH